MNQPRPLPKDQLVMGLHTIQELLKYAPEKLLKVFAALPKGAKERKSQILIDCEKKGIEVQIVSFDLLTKMTGSDSHQSFAAQVKGRRYYSVKEFLEKTREQSTVFVLMLDEIHDPQNFGALLRSSECFGVDAVAWSKNRGCDLSPTVSKTSCGASELIDLLRISNLADAVEQFKKEGFEIVASLANPDAKPLYSIRYAPKTVLIMGSEGEGIQPLLQKRADRHVYIPLLGKIQSLNVAQAAAIFLAWRQGSDSSLSVPRPD